MIIYRVEHKIYGMGPYSSIRLPARLKYALQDLWDRKNRAFYDSAAGYDACPYPTDVKRGYYFAFKNIASLKAWFDHADMLHELQKLDFICRIYEVNEKYTATHDSSGQISFNKRFSKCLDEMMLDKLDI